MNTAPTPIDDHATDASSASAPVKSPIAQCARCKQPAELDDSGFCDRCLAELEKACL